MKKKLLVISVLIAMVVPVLNGCSAMHQSKMVKEARESVESLDPVMGDWEGISISSEGKLLPMVAQVIALGNGTYRANLLDEFDKRIEPIAVLDGIVLDGGTVSFSGQGVIATIEGDQFSGSSGDGNTFYLYKVYRVSPSLGQKPEKGAVVLFNGKNYKNWSGTKSQQVPWKIVDGAMEVVPRKGGIITKEQFGDFKLHIEFRTPFEPEGRGQGRGNSGVYLQGRYELQVLDSYGLEGRAEECGGIYQRWDEKRSPHGFEGRAPLVNAALPPGQWQSYDITFRAPRFDGNGNKIANARLEKVIHNGVVVHDNVELTGSTRAALYSDEKPTGPIMLQGHGHEVQYRNIWLVKLP